MPVPARIIPIELVGIKDGKGRAAALAAGTTQGLPPPAMKADAAVLLLLLVRIMETSAGEEERGRGQVYSWERYFSSKKAVSSSPLIHIPN